MSTTGFVPVQPGRRDHRGIAFAPTRRLRELRDYYSARADDATLDESFRTYSRDLVDEVVAEIARRNRAEAPRTDTAEVAA